jgi:hypothetical protein
VTRIGNRRGAYRDLVGRHEGRRPLGRPRPMWDYNIKMDNLEVGWGLMASISVAQDRYSWRAIVNVVIILRVP